MRRTTDACASPFAGGDNPLTPVVTGVVTAATLAVAFGLMALGVESFWVTFVVGFGGVLPLSVAALEYREATDDTPARAERSDADAALEELQLRYARGELTDEEFERQAERLLETEPRPATGAAASGVQDEPSATVRKRT
jgi:uncharacterized membrane protein